MKSPGTVIVIVIVNMVICDLDHTLINTNSFSRAMLHCCKLSLRRMRMLTLLRLLCLMTGRKMRLYTHAEMKRRILPLMSKIMNHNDIDNLVERLCAKVNPEVLEKVHSYPAEERILATAAPALYAEKLGERLGFAHTIATEMPAPGKPWHENSRQHKADAVSQKLKNLKTQKLKNLIITDHHDDLPLAKRFPDAEVILINPTQKTRDMFKTLTLTLILTLTSLTGLACTSAIIGAEATVDGRPLLWKLRDTSTTDNKVEYIPAQDGAYGYVALFNAKDRKLEQAWMGMNSEGFAVMNTASYNIKDDKVPNSKMDREGYVMTIALRSCRTVDDFEQLLRTLPRPMGVEANFGVIDALGNGAYFETNNHCFVRYDLKDAPGHVLIRTNYSHSGRPNEGYGFIREANAEKLLVPYVETQSVTPEVLTEVVSRSFYHDLKGKDMSTVGERWIIDQDFIPRYKSTGTFVIEGIPPIESLEDLPEGFVRDQYIMWTGIGYPPCSEILPVWCTPDGVPDVLRGIGPNGHSTLGDEVKARRDDVFSLRKGNKDKYIDMTKLFNDEGTGYVQRMRELNHQTYERVRANRKARF